MNYNTNQLHDPSPGDNRADRLLTPAAFNEKTLHQAALAYGKRGWHVFPLKPRTKEPFFTGWPDRATDDLATINTWWSYNPEYNIGLHCGPASGVVVVDLDPKSGGFDSWYDLLDIHGTVDTLSAITGGDGEHLFFLQPDGVDLRNTQGNIGRGIDTRAWHGYVVLAPSIHPSGGIYEWQDFTPPAPIPAWLLAAWMKVTPNQGGPAIPAKDPLPGDLQEWVNRQCQAWGLKREHNGEYRGTCPFPHYDGACECDRAFRVNPERGKWWCHCPDHPKTDDCPTASGWLVSRGYHPGGSDEPIPGKGGITIGSWARRVD